MKRRVVFGGVLGLGLGLSPAVSAGDCWQMSSSELTVGGMKMAALDAGPVIHLDPSSAGMPPDTMLFLENHTATTYHNPMMRTAGMEMSCTFSALVALPVKRSGTAGAGSFKRAAGPKSYREGASHRCTPETAGASFGVTDAGTAYIGVLSSMLVAVDGGEAPMTYARTSSGGSERLTLTREVMSRDGVPTRFSVVLEEVSASQCVFSGPLRANALAAYPR